MRYVLMFVSIFGFMFLEAKTQTAPKSVQVVRSSQAEDDAIIDHYKQMNPWGMNVSIDIYGCDVEMIKSEDAVRQFLKELVAFIHMKAYGEPLIKNFGPNPRLYGISALQLIETSSITAHFAPDTKAVHIDIFSCTSFRPNAAGVFCRDFFKANELIVSDAVFRF